MDDLPHNAPGPVPAPCVGVYVDSPDEVAQTRATQLAAQLGLPIVHAPTEDALLLAVTTERLELRLTGRRAPSPLCVNFVGGRLGYSRRINRFGLLFQAVGMRGTAPRVIDATAGLGRDAFLLAYHGCRVLALERNPIVAALLQDGLERALREPELAERLARRLQLAVADARDYLRSLPPAEAPDVIYLDPMFPPKKKSALVKKEMRILRQLVGDDPDAAELFQLARGVARRRVVVKRLRLAPVLAPDPAFTYADKTTRYDVYGGRA